MKLASGSELCTRMRELGWITPQEEAAAHKKNFKYGRIESFQAVPSLRFQCSFSGANHLDAMPCLEAA